MEALFECRCRKLAVHFGRRKIRRLSSEPVDVCKVIAVIRCDSENAVTIERGVN